MKPLAWSRTPAAMSGLDNDDAAFNDFMESLSPALRQWDYFVNWDKVFGNTAQLEMHLNLMNYLIGKPDFAGSCDELLKEHPSVVRAIPSLIVRDGESSTSFRIVEEPYLLGADSVTYDFATPADTPELRHRAIEFMIKSGLRRLFEDGGVRNLVDYVIGVEAGLDSNGRKNRSGKTMEVLVQSFLEVSQQQGHGIGSPIPFSFLSQVTPREIERQFGVIVPADRATRIFDFAIKSERTLVLMEVNFYGGGGSKLKATAGEYQELSRRLRDAGIDFVWVTDGPGWKTTRQKLREAFDDIDYLWNLAWLWRGALWEVL